MQHRDAWQNATSFCLVGGVCGLKFNIVSAWDGVFHLPHVALEPRDMHSRGALATCPFRPASTASALHLAWSSTRPTLRVVCLLCDTPGHIGCGLSLGPPTVRCHPTCGRPTALAMRSWIGVPAAASAACHVFSFLSVRTGSRLQLLADCCGKHRQATGRGVHRTVSSRGFSCRATPKGTHAEVGRRQREQAPPVWRWPRTRSWLQQS